MNKITRSQSKSSNGVYTLCKEINLVKIIILHEEHSKFQTENYKDTQNSNATSTMYITPI